MCPWLVLAEVAAFVTGVIYLLSSRRRRRRPAAPAAAAAAAAVQSRRLDLAAFTGLLSVPPIPAALEGVVLPSSVRECGALAAAGCEEVAVVGGVPPTSLLGGLQAVPGLRSLDLRRCRVLDDNNANALLVGAEDVLAFARAAPRVAVRAPSGVAVSVGRVGKVYGRAGTVVASLAEGRGVALGDVVSARRVAKEFGGSGSRHTTKTAPAPVTGIRAADGTPFEAAGAIPSGAAGVEFALRFEGAAQARKGDDLVWLGRH